MNVMFIILFILEQGGGGEFTEDFYFWELILILTFCVGLSIAKKNKKKKEMK